MSKRVLVALFALMLAVAAADAVAQTGPHKPAEERDRDRNSRETLGERLDRRDGVIRPPETGAPDMRVPAPEPDIDPGIRVPPPAKQKTDPK